MFCQHKYCHVINELDTFKKLTKMNLETKILKYLKNEIKLVQKDVFLNRDKKQ
jgi:hypothetical protein